MFLGYFQEPFSETFERFSLYFDSKKEKETFKRSKKEKETFKRRFKMKNTKYSMYTNMRMMNLINMFQNKFFSRTKCSFPFYVAEVYSEPCQKSKMELFAKIVTTLKPLTNVAKKVHRRCSTGF